MYHALGHLRIAMDVLYASIAFLLYLSCRNDTLPYLRARLTLFGLGNIVERYGEYLTLYVDTAGDYRASFSFVNSCHVIIISSIKYD